MQTGTLSLDASAAPRHRLAPWALVAGLALLYGPTYWDFLFGFWASEAQGHELLVIGVSAWLVWRKRAALAALPAPQRTGPATLLFVIGLLLYGAGRYLSQLHINLRIELTSQFVVLLALLLAFKGWHGVRMVAFPLAFLLFAMPLPGALVTAITMPMKQAVSACAVWLLGGLDYPVGRSGVVITIGQYQLLVAEACAGLQTMFTLEALGLLYVNLMAYRSAWRSVAMSILAVPAAFAANVVRVAVLALVTFHFGDAAGQGFMHGFAGIVLFIVALSLLVGLDWATGRASRAAR
jgi:exosortase B